MTTTITTRPPRRTAGTKPSEARRALRALAFATPVFLVAATLSPGGLFRERRFRDVGVYGDYAQSLLDGRIPYRDFFVEYPPGGFLVFTPPAFLPDGWYLQAFKTLMAVLGLGTLLLVGMLLARLGADDRTLYGWVLAVAASPLVVGPVLLNTYDLFPAFLVVASLAALVWGRDSLGLALLGVAAAAKLFALALLPLLVFWLWRNGRALVTPLLAFGTAVAVVVAPFAVLGWDGLIDSVDAQAGRALQIESLGAAILLAAHRLGLYDAEVVRGSTEALSRDLDGALPDALAAATSLIQLAAVALVVVFFVRGRPTPQRLLAAAAATLAGCLVFSRFVSPQYLVWLLPLLPFAGVLAAALLAAALLVGRLWFFHYRDLFALEGIAWLVVVRDLLLVVLYAVLLRMTIPSSSKTFDHAELWSSSASGTAAVEGSERLSR